MNLIPTQASLAPSYFCTWESQNCARPTLSRESGGAPDPQDFLNEELLLGPRGWARGALREDIRPDLFFLIDQGWDTPFDHFASERHGAIGHLTFPRERYPSFTGTPTENLRRLNQELQALGWRGLAIWVAPREVGDDWTQKATNWTSEQVENHWRTRLEWSRDAGIGYWKVDWGPHCLDSQWRRLLTELGREVAPDLIIEHAANCGPFNDLETSWDTYQSQNTGRYESYGRIPHLARDFAGFGDVLRVYDVTLQLSVASTLDRVAFLLEKGVLESANSRAKQLINAEDELYMGAVLGCTLGIMRTPFWRDGPGNYYAPLNSGRRMDETTRAIRWTRLAPAWGLNEGGAQVSSQVLCDSWLYRKGDSWAGWVEGREIAQSAPAIVARGLPLPRVQSEEPNGEVPYVVASRHPNGAVAVATLPRTSPTQGVHLPRAKVTLEVGEPSVPIGVFGEFATLELHFANSVEGTRLWAQDLASDQAFDATSHAVFEGQIVRLSGDFIRRYGLQTQSSDDQSEPGLVLRLEKP